MNTRDFVLHELAPRSTVSLDVALLTNRGMHYATARLSFVYLRALLRTAVHAAEIMFLIRAFPMEFAAPLFAMRAVFGLGSSLSWGFLEGLRRRVRETKLGMHPELAGLAIEAWSCVSACVGLVILALCVARLTRATDMAWAFDGLYGTYLLVNAVTLTVDLWSRALHAGAFALGRVHRPRWTILVPDVLELAMIVGLWGVLGPFSLGASLLVTSLMRSALTLVYTRRAYRRRKLPWPRLMRFRSVARIGRSELLACARGFLGSVPSQLDRVLLMVLLSARTPGHILPLAAPYYALRPIAAVAQGWARTYYVDLVRMDSLAATLFRVRLSHLLRRVSVIAGALAGAGLVAGGTLLFGRAGAEAALWLVPLCLVRSHFSELQIRAIAFARTDALAALSLVMVGVVLAVRHESLSDRNLVAAVSVMLVFLAAVAHVVERLAKKQRPTAHKLTTGAWLAELCAQAVPVRVHAACVDSKLARPSAIMQLLQSESAAQRTTRIGRMWILWWERADVALGEVARATLLSGTCSKHATCEGPTGWDALNAACQAGILPDELSNALRARPGADSERELRERFASSVPGVLIVDGKSASAQLAELSEGELRQLRRALLAEAREQQIVPRRAPWQVAVYAPRGEPSLVFAWPAHAPNTGTLRRLVAQMSWRSSLPRALDAKPAPPA